MTKDEEYNSFFHITVDSYWKAIVESMHLKIPVIKINFEKFIKFYGKDDSLHILYREQMSYQLKELYEVLDQNGDFLEKKYPKFCYKNNNDVLYHTILHDVEKELLKTNYIIGSIDFSVNSPIICLYEKRQSQKEIFNQTLKEFEIK